jgi:predicted phosphoribosyltransferase
MGLLSSELCAAGRRLAHELRGYARREDVVVVALRPGVIPLAAEIARSLQAPLDLFLVRPLVIADTRRLEIGAVASGGVLILDKDAIRAHAVPPATIALAAQAVARELDQRERTYRGDHASPDLRNRKIVVVDDGRTDVASLRMAVAALRRCWVERVVLAAPTMTELACRQLLREADEVVAALTDDAPATDGTWSHGEEISPQETARLLREAALAPARMVPLERAPVGLRVVDQARTS